MNARTSGEWRGTSTGGALLPAPAFGHAWFASCGPRLPATRAGSLPPALRAAEGALAARARPVERRATRIPLDALVSVSRTVDASPSPERRLRLEPPRPAATANDNAAPPSGSKKGLLRTVVREVVFLLIMAATLYGVFQIGRMHAYQNVIVVPEPTNPASKLTGGARPQG